MTELMHIGEYVFKTAKTIASVIDEEVVICDNEMNLVGDSKCGTWAELENKSVNREAILLDAMHQRQTVVQENIKESMEGCIACENIEKCDINSIIALPILWNGKVLGCIGLYSKEKDLRKNSENRIDFLTDFVYKMSELLLSKLNENRENKQLKILKKQLQEVLDNLGSAVVCLDDRNQIIYGNKLFARLFRLEFIPVKITDIPEIVACKELADCLKSVKSIYNKELQFHLGDAKVLRELVTVVPVDVDDNHMGNVIYFKNSEKYYEEINRVTSSHSHVTFDDVIGTSSTIENLKRQAMIVADSASTVLMEGESGTGKEIISRAIHNASARSKGPFVTVNCAAIPDNLLESELFGYEEGAFTGALKGGRIGKFQLANKGTLLLDEVGEMPLHLQAKLLRAIQERRIQRIGSARDTDIDIRIIAATNRNLEDMIKSGEFREDLFYRLNVIPLRVPSLRERRSDIPILIDVFIKRYNRILNKEIKGFTGKALRILVNYDWPGNVRELQNIVEYCVNICNKPLVDTEYLPDRVKNIGTGLQPIEIKSLKEVEQMYINEAIKVFGDSTEGKQKAADALGIGIATLYRKLRNK